MQEKHVELFIPGELKEEPVICHIIRNYKIDIKIVEASFSTESGWAYLLVHGEDEEIERMFEYLRGKGIKIDEQ